MVTLGSATLCLSAAAVEESGIHGSPPGPAVRHRLPAQVLLRDELEHWEDSIHHTCRSGEQVHFTAGLVGRGAWVDGTDRLIYPTCPTIDVRGPHWRPRRNFLPGSGTVDFWHRPDYPSDDGQRHVLFYTTGGVGGDPNALERSNTILLEKTVGGSLRLTLVGPRKPKARGSDANPGSATPGSATLWRVTHPDARWKRGQWHHFAIAWQGDGRDRPPAAWVFFDGRAARAAVDGFRLAEVGAELSFGGADGYTLSRGAFDRIRTWDGVRQTFGDLDALRRAARDNDSRYAGRLVNDPLEDVFLTSLSGGKILGQRMMSPIEARRRGAKGWKLRNEFLDDGYVDQGHTRRGFAARAEPMAGQELPPHLVYPTRIAAGALWQRSSIWPPRGSFELWFKPDKGYEGKRRTLFHLDEAPPPGTPMPRPPARPKASAAMSWVIDPGNRLVLTFQGDDGNVVRLSSPSVALPAGQWVHLACSWDLDARHFAQYLGGKRLEAAGEFLTPRGRLSLNRRVALFLDVGHEKGRHVLGGVIDGIKTYDRPRSGFPSAWDVTFHHTFSSRWSNVADYAEGETIAFGLADPDADGLVGSGVRIAGRSRLYFLGQIVQHAAKDIPIGNIDPNQGTASFWVRPSAATLDGSRRMLLYLRLRGWSSDAIALYLQGGRVHLHVARVADVATSPRTSGGPKWPAEQWRHVAVTWSRHTGEAAIYIDGKRAAHQKDPRGRKPKPIELPLYPVTEWWSLGSGESWQQTAQATFDELTLYRRVLAPDRIARLARKPTAEGNTPQADWW